MENKNIIVKSIFGSHLYGTDNENSDRDYKAVYLPSKEDCYLNRIEKSINHTTGKAYSKNSKDDIDEETFSLQYFFKLVYNGEMIVIDLLHAPVESLIVHTPIWSELRANRHRFYSKNLSGYLGYIRKQTAKYGIKGSRLNAMEELLKLLELFCTGLVNDRRLGFIWDKLPINEYCKYVDNPKEYRWKSYECCGKQLQENMTFEYAYEIIKRLYDSYGSRALQAQKNEGIDWKAVSHAFRAGLQLKEIYTIGNLIYPLKDATFIKNIKEGNFHYMNDGIGDKLEDLLVDVEELARTSTYPEKIDMEWFDDFIINCYRR